MYDDYNIKKDVTVLKNGVCITAIFTFQDNPAIYIGRCLLNGYEYDNGTGEILQLDYSMTYY